MVTVEDVAVPGCVDCAKFKKFWESIKGDFPSVILKDIDATTPEGMDLVSKYSIFASPGIIINGQLLSTGPVNKEAFVKKIKELGGGA